MDHAPNFHATRRLILTSAYEGDMFRSLASVVSYVHLLWELVLLSEPIVVMASSPTGCSEMVQALIAWVFPCDSCKQLENKIHNGLLFRMIAPLKYCADHRPYFTIHDSEFKEYTTDAPSPPAVILGVTNPFFAKTLQHWPHIIRISNGITNGKFALWNVARAERQSSLCFRESKVQNKEIGESQSPGLETGSLYAI